MFQSPTVWFLMRRGTIGKVAKKDLFLPFMFHRSPAVPGDTGYLLHSMTLEIADLKCVSVPPPNKDEWKKYIVFW